MWAHHPRTTNVVVGRCSTRLSHFHSSSSSLHSFIHLFVYFCRIRSLPTHCPISECVQSLFVCAWIVWQRWLANTVRLDALASWQSSHRQVVQKKGMFLLLLANHFSFIFSYHSFRWSVVVLTSVLYVRQMTNQIGAIQNELNLGMDEFNAIQVVHGMDLPNS